MNTGQNKYALTIGCSYQQNVAANQLRLNGTINDAQNMTNFLSGRGYTVTFMRDDRNVSDPLFPSKANILTQIRTILSGKKSGDDIVMFYAGHGVQTANKAIDNIPDDLELDGQDEAIVPADFNSSTFTNLIVDDELNYYLRLYSVANTNVLFITDCCHSGTVCDLKYSYKYAGDPRKNSDFISNNELTYEELKDTAEDISLPIKANVITFSGCQDDETSKEASLQFVQDKTAKMQGVLTGAFIDTVTKNSTVTSDVFKILKGVMTYTGSFNQNPKVSSNRPLHIDSSYRAVLGSSDTAPTTTQPPVPTRLQPTTTVQPPKVTPPVKPVSTTKPSYAPSYAPTYTPSYTQTYKPTYGSTFNQIYKPNSSPYNQPYVSSSYKPTYSTYYPQSITSYNMSKYLV
ncbi:caspase domain protein [Yasminevirus sp. GU-2018]|uniref:Caspase domain protein n=1 Tax=Yasminevirus sp. GU-2018 TaxID=2420051 RepID=A0A5K0U9P7_9VIRU|nr:caspase domain protein [Yasminevirus sp. GU-2018]